MKLKFKNQDFQTDAVNAVVDLFMGQEKTHSTFSVVEENQMMLMNDFGIGNALYIDRNTLSDNMHAVQKRNLLPLTECKIENVECKMKDMNSKFYILNSTF